MGQSLRKWFAVIPLLGTLTITIPDAKDAMVVAAKDAYNLRTGASLTLLQYVKQALRQEVIGDLASKRQLQTQANAQATATAVAGAAAAAVIVDEATLATEGGGW